MSEAMREYTVIESGPDGYPAEWHATIKHAVREAAGHRCVRCRHPYRKGENGRGEWSTCDEKCRHQGPYRYRADEGDEWHLSLDAGWDAITGEVVHCGHDIEAQWRILTVHHLDGIKLNCRWWNLAALCQRCHLSVQGRVVMSRSFFLEHSDWFKPYAAGYYAWTRLGEDLSREAVQSRLDELLALACVVEAK